jgi:hypothetical protein
MGSVDNGTVGREPDVRSAPSDHFPIRQASGARAAHGARGLKVLVSAAAATLFLATGMSGPILRNRGFCPRHDGRAENGPTSALSGEFSDGLPAPASTPLTKRSHHNDDILSTDRSAPLPSSGCQTRGMR